MTALMIILAVIALILLVAMTGITVILKADGDMTCTLKILFFRLRLFPKKEKKPKLRNFRIKNFRRMRLREEKKQLKQAKKRAEKDRKKAKKAEKAPKEPEEKPAFRDEVHYYLELARTALLAAVKKFGKYLVITVRKIDITVSGDDPAKIALTYGYAVQTAAYIKELADNTLKTKYRGEAPNIAVGVDWLSGKSSIVLDISMKIRVWQIISVLFTALKGYISVDKPKPGKKDNGGKDENDKDGETAEAAPGNGNKPAMAVNGG